jgi:uncharacterized protein
MRGNLGVWVLFACLGFVPCRGADRSGPGLDRVRPQGHVSDFAGVIPDGVRRQMETLAAELKAKAAAEMAIVTLPSLEGGQIDDVANRLYEKWGIGDRKTDRGVLILAAMQDRKIRVEVGYGLEPLLPDARCGRILDEFVIPQIRAGRQADGLYAGASAIARVIAEDSRVSLEAVPARTPAAPPASSPFAGAFQLLFLIVAVIVVLRHPWLLLFLGSGSPGRSTSHGGGRGGFSGGFGGFGGGRSGGGGASRGW